MPLVLFFFWKRSLHPNIQTISLTFRRVRRFEIVEAALLQPVKRSCLSCEIGITRWKQFGEQNSKRLEREWYSPLNRGGKGKRSFTEVSCIQQLEVKWIQLWKVQSLESKLIPKGRNSERPSPEQSEWICRLDFDDEKRPFMLRVALKWVDGDFCLEIAPAVKYSVRTKSYDLVSFVNHHAIQMLVFDNYNYRSLSIIIELTKTEKMLPN